MERFADHMLDEEQTAGIWNLHQTSLAAWAAREIELVDARILKAEATATGTKTPSTTTDAPMDPPKDEMGVEPPKDDQDGTAKLWDTIKTMKDQMDLVHKKLAKSETEAVAAAAAAAEALQALNAQRLQELAFLRFVDDMEAEQYKGAPSAPSEPAQEAMLRTHQVLSDWSAGGQNMMFTMKHLDTWAGLNCETKMLMDLVLGSSQHVRKRGWATWFPEKPTDDTIIPRAMALTLLKALTNCKKVWERNAERSKALRLETNGLYSALEKESKRRCTENVQA